MNILLVLFEQLYPTNSSEKALVGQRGSRSCLAWLEFNRSVVWIELFEKVLTIIL